MAELEYGFARGQYILVKAGTERFAVGTVVFTPVEPDEIVDDATQYTREKVDAVLNGDGWLIAGAADRVRLPVGRWEVTFRGVPGLTIKPFQFDVVAGQTVLLPQVQPITPSPAVKFVVNEAVYTQTLAARDAAQAAVTDAETVLAETVIARDEARQAAEDAAVPTETYVDGRIASKRNTADGLAPLGGDSKVPAANLPMAAIASSAEVTSTFVAFGPTDPAATLPPGTEYVWNKTDGAGTLLDIVSGVA